MTASSNFAQRALAVFAAFGMTTFMIVASFSTSSSLIVPGILA